MKALIATLVLLFSCASASCQQPTAATKEDVEELLRLTSARQQMQQILAGIARQAATAAVDTYSLHHPNASPQQLRRVAEVVGQSWQASLKVVSVDELVTAVIPIYQRHFTHDEMQSIIEFYRSPAGQRYVRELPAMMTESMQAAEPIVKKHLPEIEAAAEKAVQQQQRTNAASSTTGRSHSASPN